MKYKERKRWGKEEKIKLEEILDKKHGLYKLAEKIDWEKLEEELGGYYGEKGRPGLKIRLMAGIHYLKYIYNVGDEQVVERWVENPYWQHLCGEKYFQHKFPCHPTSLVKWRKRVGEKGIEKLLKETIEVVKRSGKIKRKEVEKVNCDTTVQEKAITYPIDGKLYHKMRESLCRQAKKENIKVRQSYVRLSKKALRKVGKYIAANQQNRMRKETKKLKTYLARVMRDIIRKSKEPSDKLLDMLFLAESIITQGQKDRRKIYSVHAPEVECIGKGKVNKKYEFGCKVSIVTTSKKGWIIAANAWKNNPYDAHILKDCIKKAEELTQFNVKQVFVDKAFRGSEHHPEKIEVFISGRKNLSPSLSRWLDRRSAIEPIIGHAKFDHRLDRNFLLGFSGDSINVLLSASAFNLRKLFREFFVLFSFIFSLKHYRSSLLTSSFPLT